MYTFPDVHIRVHPTSRKEQKYPDQYTEAHPPPVGYTRYFHPRCVHTCAPTPGYAQRSVLPQDVSNPGTRGCKREQEASPEGTRRRMKGPSAEPRRGGAPVRPPSVLTVDAGLVRHGSAFGSPVPSELSAWSWPGSTRLAWTQELRRMWRRRRASRSFPGGAAGPAPSAPRPRRARPAEAGIGAARARSRRRGLDGSVLGLCHLPGQEGAPSDVSVVTCRPRSWRTVGGCALGCGRDCALTAEKV